MNLTIHYRVAYRYREEVSFSPHVFRLLPRSDTNLALKRTAFRTNTGADVQYRRDLFDNVVVSCFYPENAAVLEVAVDLELQVGERNPFHFLLASHATDFPFQYTDHERRVLAPYLEASQPSIALPFWTPSPQPTMQALIQLNTAIFQNLNYERREEGEARSPNETLQFGAGACRDFAVLMAEAFRGVGVAARLASGYLWEGERAASERTAENALHAWTEAYLPGAGWVGFDPANGILCDHCHIPTAVGIAPEDIAPISGRYYAPRVVESHMETELKLTGCMP